MSFIREEAASGLALLAATVAALVWANTAGDGYVALWTRDATVAGLELDLRHWVNDALMAIFFLVVGLEIKRELVTGRLRDPRAAMLPMLAAAGGVLAPIAIFVALTAGGAGAAGWAIPCATDIAFAVGIVALLGDRVSPGARLFLLAIAIVDDIIAIAVIAIFYAETISLAWLLAAAALVGLVAVAARLGVTRIAAYALFGVALWVCVHESGVHGTIAGVALGLLLPAGPAAWLEDRLHPVSAFAVVPLFALANAGVDLGGGVLADAAGSRLTWAIAAGLVVGKLLGISGAARLALRRRWGTLPDGMARPQLAGIAAAGGIGFTVSLFIAQLAFDDAALVDEAKVGIFAGSLLSAALAALLLTRPR
jgi:NhaA family Na+:H+ antiporter